MRKGEILTPKMFLGNDKSVCQNKFFSTLWIFFLLLSKKKSLIMVRIMLDICWKKFFIADGWTKIDVSNLAKKWVQFDESQVNEISLVCKTCNTTENQSPFSTTDSHKPFIVVYTHSHSKSRETHRRRKRSVNCNMGLNECCRESLYVSFADMGWDDWIIKPEGYNAYFCKGSCTTPSAITLSASDHNSILQVG